MHHLLFLCLAVSSFSSALWARDHVGGQSKNAVGPLQFNHEDGTIMSPTRQYPVSLTGLRQYLDSELQNTRSYEQLNSKLNRMENQSSTAFKVSLTSTGLGIASLLVGASMRQDKEPTEGKERERHAQGGRLMIYGVGAIVGGIGLYSILSPDESDIHAFINKHNSQASGGGFQSSSRRTDSFSLSVFSNDQILAVKYSF